MSKLQNFREGDWLIESVVVNQTTVLNREGFQSLQLRGDKLTIQPLGMEFEVEPETHFSALLTNRGRRYFADWTVDGDGLELVLSQPGSRETVTFVAQFREALVPA